MRVKYDYQIFIAQKYGGISKYFSYLARELNKLNVQAEIVPLIHINEYIRKDKYLRGIKLNIKSRIIIRLFKYLNMGIDLFFYRKFNYDIVHKTYYSVISGSSSPLHSKKIITVYDMTHEIYPEYFKDSKKVSLNKLEACNNADQIICISESTKNDLIRLFNIEKKKINTVYLGIDRNIFKNLEKRSRFTKKFGHYILYVGQRSGYKNFSYIFNTYINNRELNKNFNIVVFGGEKFSHKEMDTIKAKKLEDNFFFISGDDILLSKIYNDAHVLVYTSLYEGFGLPVLEAMSCGCPVIAFRGSSIPEVAGDACILLNDMKSKIKLSSNILKLRNDSKYRNLVIKKGLTQSKKFTWEKCAKKTLNVYKKAIN